MLALWIDRTKTLENSSPRDFVEKVFAFCFPGDGKDEEDVVSVGDRIAERFGSEKSWTCLFCGVLQHDRALKFSWKTLGDGGAFVGEEKTSQRDHLGRKMGEFKLPEYLKHFRDRHEFTFEDDQAGDQADDPEARPATGTVMFTEMQKIMSKLDFQKWLKCNYQKRPCHDILDGTEKSIVDNCIAQGIWNLGAETDEVEARSVSSDLWIICISAAAEAFKKVKSFESGCQVRFNASRNVDRNEALCEYEEKCWKRFEKTDILPPEEVEEGGGRGDNNPRKRSRKEGKDGTKNTGKKHAPKEQNVQATAPSTKTIAAKKTDGRVPVRPPPREPIATRSSAKKK
jgi:hypothetical protein